MKGAQRAFLISFVFVLKLTSASTTSDDLYSSSSSSNRIPGSYPSEVSSLHEVSDYEDCNSDFFETVDTSRPTSVRFHSDVSPQDSGLFSPGLPPSSHVVPTTTQAPAPISPPVTANIVKQTLLSKPSTDRLATLQSSNPPIIFRFINADRQDLISWNEQQLKTLIKTNVNTVHHHCDVGRGLTAFGKAIMVENWKLLKPFLDAGASIPTFDNPTMNALQFAAHFNRTWSLRFLLKTPGYTDLVEAPPIPPNMLPAQFAIESDNPIMLDELVKLRPHDPLYSSLLYSPEDGNIDLAGFALVMNREWKTFKHIIEKYVLDVTNIHAGGIDKPRFFSPTFGVNPGPASAIHSPIIVDVAKPDVGSSSHQALIDQLARECLFRNYTLLEIAAACVLHDLPGVYSPHTQSWLQGSMIKWLVSVAGAGTFNGPQHQARKIFTESSAIHLSLFANSPVYTLIPSFSDKSRTFSALKYIYSRSDYVFVIPDRGYIRFDGQHFLLLPSRYGRNFFDLAVSYKVDVSVLKWIYGISSQIPAGGDEKWRSVDVVEGVKELQHPRLDGLMRPKIEAWKRDGYSITKNAKVTENAVVEVKKEKEEDVKWDAEEVDGRQEEMMEIRPINPQDVSSRKEPVVGSAAVAVAAPASVVPPSKLEMDIQSLMSIYSLAESLVQQELQQLFPVSGSSNDSTIFNNSPTTAMLYFNSLLDVAAVAAAATASQSTTSSSPVSSTLNNNINNKSSKKKKKKKKLKNRASSGKSFSGSTTQFTNENPALWNLVALPDNHISNIVKIITGANHLNSHIYTNCRIYARKEWESWSLFENLGHLVRVKPGAIPSFAFDNGLHVASVLEMAVGKSDLSDEGLNRLLSGFEDHVHVAWHEITQFCGIGDTMEYFSPFNDEYLPSTSSFLKLNLVISTSKFISLALEQGNQFGFPFAASGPHNEVAGKYWTSLESKIVWPKLCNIDSEDEVPMSDHLAVVSEAVKLVVLKWGSQELEINTSVTNDRLWKRFRAVLEWIMKKEMN